MENNLIIEKSYFYGALVFRAPKCNLNIIQMKKIHFNCENTYLFCDKSGRFPIEMYPAHLKDEPKLGPNTADLNRVCSVLPVQLTKRVLIILIRKHTHFKSRTLTAKT